MARAYRDCSPVLRSDDGLFSAGTHKALPSLTATQAGVMLAIDGVLIGEDGPVEGAETLIERYRRDGFRPLIESLNGEFALALYDSRKRTLIWRATASAPGR